VASRPRAFLRIKGPDAEDFLQRMLSNDVEALAETESCEALLLTPKARVIATLRVQRRGPDNFLLLTEPELGERVLSHLLRMRLGAKVEIELENLDSILVLGAPHPGTLNAIANEDYGMPAFESIARRSVVGDDVARISDEELEALRIRARTPRYGKEIDERVLPAEAGLVERAVSFTKGCYPGQEPIARLHYRGHANRGLCVLEIAGDALPPYDAEVRYGDRAVGRVTSAAREPDGRIVALAFVRTEVPDDTELRVNGAPAHVSR
jgi:folate-binding protein YgfZ